MRLDDFSREYLDKHYRLDWNTVKLGKNVGKLHQLGMMEVCRRLLARELPFLTEVVLVGGGRADVVSPLTNEIFEVMVSEEDARCDAKIYGKDFEIVKVRVSCDIFGRITFLAYTGPRETGGAIWSAIGDMRG